MSSVVTPSRLHQLLARIGFIRRRLGPVDARCTAVTEALLAGTELDHLHARHRRPLLVDVPLVCCRVSGFMAFSCGPQALNPFIATARGYASGKLQRYEDSPLHRYYQVWQPRTAAELMGLRVDGEKTELRHYPPAAAMWPWHDNAPEQQLRDSRASFAAENREMGLGEPEQAGTENYGPVSEEKGRQEFARLASLVDEIRKSGIQRHDGADGDVQGIILRHGNRAAVLIKKGKHRASVAAALGHASMPVRLFAHKRAVVDCGDVGEWGTVRSGLLTRGAAVAIVRRMIDGAQPFPEPVRVNLDTWLRG